MRVVFLISIGNWSVSQPRSGEPVLESMDPSIPSLREGGRKREREGESKRKREERESHSYKIIYILTLMQLQHHVHVHGQQV